MAWAGKRGPSFQEKLWSTVLANAASSLLGNVISQGLGGAIKGHYRGKELEQMADLGRQQEERGRLAKMQDYDVVRQDQQADLAEGRKYKEGRELVQGASGLFAGAHDPEALAMMGQGTAWVPPEQKMEQAPGAPFPPSMEATPEAFGERASRRAAGWPPEQWKQSQRKPGLSLQDRLKLISARAGADDWVKQNDYTRALKESSFDAKTKGIIQNLIEARKAQLQPEVAMGMFDNPFKDLPLQEIDSMLDQYISAGRGVPRPYSPGGGKQPKKVPGPGGGRKTITVQQAMETYQNSDRAKRKMMEEGPGALQQDFQDYLNGLVAQDYFIQQ
jgi:hypothetical protein